MTSMKSVLTLRLDFFLLGHGKIISVYIANTA